MVAWMTQDGKHKIEVEAVVTECLDQQGRGRQGTACVRLDLTVDGRTDTWQQITPTSAAQQARQPGIVASVGRVGLTAERMAAIQDDIASASLDPRVVAHDAAVARAYADRAEYEAITRRIEAMGRMGDA